MRLVVCLLSVLLICSGAASGHKRAVLRFFTTGPDSSIGGVKTERDEIIVPPHFYLLWNEPGEKITDQIFFLMDTTMPGTPSAMHYNYRLKAFDRTGKFLYAPFWYDNGPDYNQEGLSRFVENEKMGWVDFWGNKVIPAKYSFVAAFEGGVAEACYDCEYVVFDSKDPEHCCGYAGSKWVLVDRKGRELVPVGDHTAAWKTNMDSFSRRYFLMQTFTEQESKIVQRIKCIKEVKQALWNYDSTGAVVPVIFIHHPSEAYNRYIVSVLAGDAIFEDAYQFTLNAKGKKIKHIDHNFVELPLRKWRKEYKNFFGENNE